MLGFAFSPCLWHACIVAAEVRLFPYDGQLCLRNLLARHAACGGGQVHGGFLDAYDSVHTQVLRLMDDLTSRGSGWRILCTGHSLGMQSSCAFYARDAKLLPAQ